MRFKDLHSIVSPNPNERFYQGNPPMVGTHPTMQTRMTGLKTMRMLAEPLQKESDEAVDFEPNPLDILEELEARAGEAQESPQEQAIEDALGLEGTPEDMAQDEAQGEGMDEQFLEMLVEENPKLVMRIMMKYLQKLRAAQAGQY